MKIGILGTGIVGSTIGSKLVELGHEVKMGSRSRNNEKAIEWVKSVGSDRATQGNFAEATSFGELIFNCTSGANSLEALRQAGGVNLQGKILIDVANPLDFSKGMPPTLSVCNTDSLGEQIQREFPQTKVVKALNTMNCKIMVNPKLVRGEHDVFLCGNDFEAKTRVTGILKSWFGWTEVIDLGDISAAKGMEMVLPLWLSLIGKYQNPNFNFKIARGF